MNGWIPKLTNLRFRKLEILPRREATYPTYLVMTTLKSLRRRRRRGIVTTGGPLLPLNDIDAIVHVLEPVQFLLRILEAHTRDILTSVLEAGPDVLITTHVEAHIVTAVTTVIPGVAAVHGPTPSLLRDDIALGPVHPPQKDTVTDIVLIPDLRRVKGLRGGTHDVLRHPGQRLLPYRRVLLLLRHRTVLLRFRLLGRLVTLPPQPSRKRHLKRECPPSEKIRKTS